MNKTISLNERFLASLKLSKVPRNSAKSRVKNRCEITGRSRGYYRKLRMLLDSFNFPFAKVGIFSADKKKVKKDADNEKDKGKEKNKELN